MYTISKKFNFSASHQLRDLPETHPCSHLHGHNYTVTVELKSDALSDTGFVLDYRSLDVCKQFIDNVYDHRDLNDVMFVNPTAENIARELFEKFEGMLSALPITRDRFVLSSVTVQETDKTPIS